jgi:hypothetical protein
VAYILVVLSLLFSLDNARWLELLGGERENQQYDVSGHVSRMLLLSTFISGFTFFPQYPSRGSMHNLSKIFQR